MMLGLGLGTKLAILGTTVGLALGFVGGKKWERADRYQDAINQIEAIQVQATESLNVLNTRWEGEAARAQIKVEEWSTQNTLDQDLVEKLITGQTDIRNRFDDINNNITITTDLGTCRLTADAIRLLREASSAANRDSGSTGD